MQSVHQVTNASGAVVRTQFTDAWGNDLEIGLPKLPTGPGDRYGFQNRESDTESGLQHFRARSYDPMTGRFTSRDPVSHPNLYIFTDNDPVNNVDPDGRDPWRALWRAMTDTPQDPDDTSTGDGIAKWFGGKAGSFNKYFPPTAVAQRVVNAVINSDRAVDQVPGVGEAKALVAMEEQLTRTAEKMYENEEELGGADTSSDFMVLGSLLAKGLSFDRANSAWEGKDFDREIILGKYAATEYAEHDDSEQAVAWLDAGEGLTLDVLAAHGVASRLTRGPFVIRGSGGPGKVYELPGSELSSGRDYIGKTRRPLLSRWADPDHRLKMPA
ncbi:MAG: YD repeat-containing [Planctomycetota bacterium]|nr:MAG: YD repeat-containing [Planctomycetota bacterium]